MEINSRFLVFNIIYKDVNYSYFSNEKFNESIFLHKTNFGNFFFLILFILYYIVASYSFP